MTRMSRALPGRPRLALRPGESGQAAVEYVYLALGVVLAVILIGYGIDSDGLTKMGNALSERLLMITTILKLPL